MVIKTSPSFVEAMAGRPAGGDRGEGWGYNLPDGQAAIVVAGGLLVGVTEVGYGREALWKRRGAKSFVRGVEMIERKRNKADGIDLYEFASIVVFLGTFHGHSGQNRGRFFERYNSNPLLVDSFEKKFAGILQAARF